MRARGTTTAALALGAIVALGACQRAGRDTDEAPSRGAGASGTTEASNGDVSNLPGMRSEQVAYDTVPKAGVAGSGTAAIGRPQGHVSPPGGNLLRGGDPTDAGVVAALALVHRQEVEAARLASGKAQAPEARTFAQTMLRTHEGPAASMRAQGNEPESTQDLLIYFRDQHAKTMQLLQRTPTGHEFDRLYLLTQVEAHRSADQLMTRLETSTRNRDLLAEVHRTEADIGRHLAEARQAQARVQAMEGRAVAGVARETTGPYPPGSPAEALGGSRGYGQTGTVGNMTQASRTSGGAGTTTTSAGSVVGAGNASRAVTGNAPRSVETRGAENGAGSGGRVGATDPGKFGKAQSGARPGP